MKIICPLCDIFLIDLQIDAYICSFYCTRCDLESVYLKTDLLSINNEGLFDGSRHGGVASPKAKKSPPVGADPKGP
jgi:hypothetical protein